MPKAYTVKESIAKKEQLNEDAKWLCEYYKDKDPELVKMLKKDISLMPSDVIYVDKIDTTEED